MAWLGWGGGSSGGKETVGQHQDRDQRQQEDGVGRVSFAVLSRDGVPRRLEDQAPNHGDHHAEENDGGGVVRDYVVERTGSS